MNRLRSRLVPAAVWLLVALLVPWPAAAQLYSCDVSAVGVSFGSYDPLAFSDTESTGEVSVTCSLLGLTSLLVNYEIELSTGGSGSYFPREMVAGTHTLEFQLYTDAARTTVWGDGSGATYTVSDGYLLGLGDVTRHYSVYGTLPANQMVAAGSYADTITVTVNYY